MKDDIEQNKLDLRMIGDRLIIAADVDPKGLRKLRKRLQLLETVLSAGGDEEDIPPPHKESADESLPGLQR